MCYDHEQRDVSDIVNKLIEESETAKKLFESIFIAKDENIEPTFKELDRYHYGRW